MRGAARAHFVPAAQAGAKPARDATFGCAGQHWGPGASSLLTPHFSVRVTNPSQIQVVEDAIKKMGFNTFSIVDATRSIRQFFKVLDAFLGIFGSLALAVASIGIVNTLVMAILERRREIGIMKAIGASDGDVEKLFFAEAGVMGVFGGIVGVALGWGNRSSHQFRNEHLSQAAAFWSGADISGRCRGGWWRSPSCFAFLVSLASGLVPSGTRRPARSRAGAYATSKLKSID